MPRSNSVSGGRRRRRSAIEPNTVARPVCTTSMRAVPLRTEVPMDTQLLRSATEAVSAAHAGRLLDRIGFPGEHRLRNEEVFRLDQHAVGGDEVAGRENDHVTRHHVAGRHILAAPATQHGAGDAHARAQALDRARGTEFLHEAQDAAAENDRQNDDRIGPVLEHGRDPGGEHQDYDERAFELAQEQPQPRGVRALADRVWTEHAEAPVGGEAAQPLMRRVQRLQQPFDRHTPIGCRRCDVLMGAARQALEQAQVKRHHWRHGSARSQELAVSIRTLQSEYVVSPIATSDREVLMPERARDKPGRRASRRRLPCGGRRYRTAPPSSCRACGS